MGSEAGGARIYFRKDGLVRMKKVFNLKIISSGTREEIVAALETVADEIRGGQTEDVGRDYIGEFEMGEGDTREVGYAYYEVDWPYADIYGNTKNK